MARFNIFTLGCKVNQVESDSIVEQLLEAGHQLVETDCDIAIINGCAVTQTAEKKSRQLISRIRKNSPQACVIFSGCAAEKISESSQTADFDYIVRNNRKHNMPSIVAALLDGKKEAALPGNYEEFPEYALSSYPKMRTRAFLKIQDGCENFCSYCIIPYLRGPVRSRPLTSIRAELDKIATAGYREIVLTGIHLGNYGLDRGFAVKLDDVVECALKHEADFRVRLGSIESPEISDRLLEFFGNGRLCRHLHLPLQSGCDSVLRRMNRKYCVNEYRLLVEKITAHYPDMAITADVITGFPGESEAEFGETLRFVSELPLAGLHVFPFSRRSGTAAWSMPGQIAAGIKKRRSAALISAGSRLHKDFLAKLYNTRQQILLEGYDDGYSYGYSGNYQKILIPGDYPRGKLLNVKVQREFRDGLAGCDDFYCQS